MGFWKKNTVIEPIYPLNQTLFH